MTDEKAIEKMLYDQQQGWPLCPRCGERMPDKLTHGALSRHAKGVYICEPAAPMKLRDWAGNVKPLSDWCWFAYTMEIFGGNRYGRNAPVTEWTVVKRSLHRLLCHGDAQRRLSEKTQRKVLDKLTRCFDDVSVEDAAQMKF